MNTFFKKSKYKAVKCSCKQGHTHMSRLEAGHCNLIHLSKGVTVKTQAKFPMVVNGELICTHYPDFLVEYKDGTKEVIESKGFETDIWKIKHKLFLALYPEIKYTVWKK